MIFLFQFLDPSVCQLLLLFDGFFQLQFLLRGGIGLKDSEGLILCLQFSQPDFKLIYFLSEVPVFPIELFDLPLELGLVLLEVLDPLGEQVVLIDDGLQIFLLLVEGLDVGLLFEDFPR